MKVSRKVIQDLLPLYLAGEVSEDTRILVETYLQTDPELAKIVDQDGSFDLNGELTISRSEEAELNTYKKSRSILVLFIVLMAGIMALVLFAIVFFLSTSV